MVVATLAALALLAGLALAGHRALAWVLARADEPMPYLRAQVLVGLPLTGLVAAGILALGGVGRALAAAVPGGPGPLAGLVAGLAYAALVPVPVTAGYAGLLPEVRAARDLDVAAWRGAARLYRWAAVVLALAVLLMQGMLVALAGGAAVAALGVPLMLAAVVWATPVLVRLVVPTRAPDDEERARLQRWCERAGLAPRGMVVRETGGAENATALLRGPPGRRTLLVSDHFLAAFDDEEAAALLAANAERARRLHLEHRLAPVVALLVALLLVFGGTAPWWVPLAVVLAAVPLQLWGYRRAYAADAAAADRVGADRLLAALERTRAVEDHGGGNRPYGLLVMRPPLDRRVDRLRARADADTSGESSEG